MVDTEAAHAALPEHDNMMQRNLPGMVAKAPFFPGQS